MLHEFLTSNRDELINRCKKKVAKRFEPSEIPTAVDHGVPLFLLQLTETLRREQMIVAHDKPEPEPIPAQSEIGRVAALHGAELLRSGFSVDQVVHDYGDVCQSVTELAVEQKALITVDEFRTLNRCLDDAIADAVTAFGQGHQVAASGKADDLRGSVDAFVDEQQWLLNIAIQSFAAIKTGSVGIAGATAALLAHTLEELHSLAERSLPEIRLDSKTTEVANHC
jgi:hypothetical protein